MQIYTIGYEGLGAASFFEILLAHKVETLIDVRAVAFSRKRGFSRTPLVLACRSHGLDYQHWPSLGCPKDIRVDYRNSQDWQNYTLRFFSYLETQDEVLRQLSQVVSRQTCALHVFRVRRVFLPPLVCCAESSGKIPSRTGIAPS